MKLAQTIISRYPPQYKKAACMPLLDLGQRQNAGWTSISVMNAVAKLLEMPKMRVYEVSAVYLEAGGEVGVVMEIGTSLGLEP